MAASATSGPEMSTENSAGSTVVIARVSDRKISTSRMMMKTSDRSCTLLPVLPVAFCSSTWTAVSPARCARSPAGSPEPAIRARSPSTRSSA